MQIMIFNGVVKFFCIIDISCFFVCVVLFLSIFGLCIFFILYIKYVDDVNFC